MPLLRRSLRLLHKALHRSKHRSIIKHKRKPALLNIEPTESMQSVPMAIVRSLLRCKYKYRGCKRKLSQEELPIHENQCRFRSYECQGKIFAGWSCNWKGYHEDIIHHFKKVHPERTYLRIQNVIDSEVKFLHDSYDIELIRRQQKQLFWFKYRLLSEEKVAYWLCQYVGPQDEALTYCYEFLIKDGPRKFAVTELCHTDAVDAKEIYESGKCVVMTFDQIKSFMREPGRLKVNFKIKKRLKTNQSK